MTDQRAPVAPEQPVPTDLIQMTTEGRARLQTELDRLIKDERPALVRRVQAARLFLAPDASTNAVSVTAYDLSILDSRIEQIADLLERVQVIPEPPDDKTVRIGSRVYVRYDDGTEESLTIVGPYEADFSKGQVSSESPAGKALLDKAAGDKVTAGTGDDTVTLTVVSISKQNDSPTVAKPGVSV